MAVRVRVARFSATTVMLRRAVYTLAPQRGRTSIIRAYSSAEPAPEQRKETKNTELIQSCCAPNTALPGLNYLKGQPAVLAKEDSEYPPWLWQLLKKKVIPEDGPGGRGEKMLMRKANKQRIKEQNFLKTQ